MLRRLTWLPPCAFAALRSAPPAYTDAPAAKKSASPPTSYQATDDGAGPSAAAPLLGAQRAALQGMPGATDDDDDDAMKVGRYFRHRLTLPLPFADDRATAPNPVWHERLNLGARDPPGLYPQGLLDPRLPAALHRRLLGRHGPAGDDGLDALALVVFLDPARRLVCLTLYAVRPMLPIC